MSRIMVLFAAIILFATPVLAQNSIDTLNRKRLRGFVIGSTATYTVSMIGLNELWYSNSPKQSFQFFNDNNEWKQVDKVGHFFGAFYASDGTYNALKWTGVDEKKATRVSAITGFALLLPIEVFDGFSEAYGASTGDLGANLLGASFFYFQRSSWNEIRIRPKFSYRHTKYAALRPDVLGDSFSSRILKDYNGQTYWLSFDMDKFIGFPKWINLAIGYGAEDMVYARSDANDIEGYDAYRQYYLGIDIDLRAIRTRSKFLKAIINIIDVVKLPAPAVELSRQRTTFRFFSF